MSNHGRVEPTRVACYTSTIRGAVRQARPLTDRRDPEAHTMTSFVSPLFTLLLVTVAAQQGGPAPALVDIDGSPATFVEDFNKAGGHIRFVSVLSPT